MKKLLIAALAASIHLSNAPAEEALKNTKEKVSYSIGIDIGRTFKRSELEIDPNTLARGIKDALTDAKPQLSDEEMQQTLQGLQVEMQSKMARKRSEEAAENKSKSEEFLEKNKKKEGVKVTDSGLQYKVLKQAKGQKPAATDMVVTHYKGTLIDGTEFDSSYTRGEPVSFPVSGVIPGWTEALQLMPEGSKWQLVIPPSLAYGENAPPQIGPNQALIFEVELLEVKKEAEGEAKAEQPAQQKPEVATDPTAAPTPAKSTPAKKKK